MIALVLAGCTSDSPGGRPLEVSGTSAEHAPSVLRVQLDEPGSAWVEYGEEALDRRTPADRDGDLAVLGLKARHTYRWRVVLETDEGRRRVSDEAEFTVPAPPDALLDLEPAVVEADAELAFVLGSVIRPELASFAAITDRDGDWVWWAEAGPDRVMVTPELSPDGRAITWTESDFAKWDDVSAFVRVELDGSARLETRLRDGHHDVVQHLDGTLEFLSMEFREQQLGTLGSVTVGTDAIQRGFLGMTDADVPVQAFSMFDDFPHDEEVTCEHLVSPGPQWGYPDLYEWTHANSFVWVEDEDAWYVNAKFTDWLMKIDRPTGELKWVLNGLHGDFTTPQGDRPVWRSVDDTTLWSHAHLSDLWAGGAMVFDNGDHRVPHVSRALEVEWDEDLRTASIVWSYDHPGGGHTSSLGDVRRMPADHVLVTWSMLGSVEEVTRDRRVVWRVTSPEDQRIGRVVPLADLYGPLGTNSSAALLMQ